MLRNNTVCNVGLQIYVVQNEPWGFLAKILFPFMITYIQRPICSLKICAFWRMISPFFIFSVEMGVGSQLGHFDRVVIDSRILSWKLFSYGCALTFQSVASDLVNCELQGSW
jgi:hypothetical protein